MRLLVLLYFYCFLMLRFNVWWVNLIFVPGLVSVCHRALNQYHPSHNLVLSLNMHVCVFTCICVCKLPLWPLTCLTANSVFLASLWSIRQWHAILMQTSTVAGKSLDSPYYCFRENTVSLKHSREEKIREKGINSDEDESKRRKR